MSQWFRQYLQGIQHGEGRTIKLIIGPTKEDGSFKVEGVLSERNLLSLLDKLYWEESARTLTSEDCYVTNEEGERVQVGHIQFRMVSEKDEDHYADRPGQYRGGMHPKTEQTLRTIREHYGK